MEKAPSDLLEYRESRIPERRRRRKRKKEEAEEAAEL